MQRDTDRQLHSCTGGGVESKSPGYTELWKRHRLDLTVEALVVDDLRWHLLFTPDEIERAKSRLREYGYGGRTNR